MNDAHARAGGRAGGRMGTENEGETDGSEGNGRGVVVDDDEEESRGVVWRWWRCTLTADNTWQQAS